MKTARAVDRERALDREIARFRAIVRDSANNLLIADGPVHPDAALLYLCAEALHLLTHAVRGLVADAARFLPELAPVVAGVVTSPTKLPERNSDDNHDCANVVAFPKRRAPSW